MHIYLTRTILLSILITATRTSNAQNVDLGKEIFKTRCASCHSIAKDLVGPALKDVDKRRSVEWIISFVHAPQTKIKSGDTIAVALFNKYNQAIMPDHSDLKDEEIKNIIEYIKVESKNLPATASNTKRPIEQYPHYMPIQWNHYWFWSTFGILLVVMIWGLYVRVKIANWKNNNQL